MHDRKCDFIGCPGHTIRGAQDLIIINVKCSTKDKQVRMFSSVDCILFFFASFPPGMLAGDIPTYLAKKAASPAKPSITMDGVGDE